MYVHVNIFKIYNVCVYLYMHNKYTQYTHIYYVNKNFILDAINRLIALINITFFLNIYMHLCV